MESNEITEAALKVMRALGEKLAKSDPNIEYNEAKSLAVQQAKAYIVQEVNQGKTHLKPPHLVLLAAAYISGLEKEKKKGAGGALRA